MTRFNLQAELKPTISDEQKQNIEKLIKDVQDSFDVPLSEIDFSELRSDVKTALSDRILTSNELEIIVSDVTDIINTAGITPAEVRTIFYDLQNIGEASRLPKTDDNLTGTSEDDILWSGLGNDTLTAADLSTAGVGEKDTLIGGGGNDSFVLGDSITARIRCFLNMVDEVSDRLGLSVSPIVKLETLRQLPPETLGRSLVDFIEQNQLESFTRGPRRKQLHDSIHVLTGYDISLVGEAEVQAFLLGAKFRLTHVILTMGILRLIFKKSLHCPDLWQRLYSAYQRGQISNFAVDCWQPETLWNLPLVQVRKQFQIN
ncbi:MAG: Coq4 family protein [Phormidium sp.]